MPPSQAATAGSALRRIPTPVWLALGGLGIGAIYVVSTRGSSDAAAADEFPAEGDIPAEQIAGVPASPVAYVTDASAPVDSGEVVGSVGQTALETLGGLLEQSFGAVVASRETQSTAIGDVMRALIEAGKYPIPPQVTNPVQPGKPHTTPGKPPKFSAPGYTRGHRLPSKYGSRNFPAAIAWARIGSGGKGKKHYIDFHIRYARRLERWRYYPNAGHRWHLSWQRPRPAVS